MTGTYGTDSEVGNSQESSPGHRFRFTKLLTFLLLQYVTMTTEGHEMSN